MRSTAQLLQWDLQHPMQDPFSSQAVVVRRAKHGHVSAHYAKPERVDSRADVRCLSTLHSGFGRTLALVQISTRLLIQ